MSPELISRSPDLGQLVDDGYDVEIVSGHMVLHRVPYVNANREVKFGRLISPVELVENRLAPPQDHTVYFTGDYPCKANGDPIEAIRNDSSPVELADGLHADHRFSARPQPDGKYRDYHHKMTTYANIVGSHAKRVDASVTMRPGRLVISQDAKDPFCFMESASSRAGITRISEVLSEDRIGIVGLGGTGSYILDYVSKARVKEIHLFDGDEFYQHNAFRSPGATLPCDIEGRHNKAHYFATKYGKMRCGVVPHPYNMTEDHYDDLSNLDFVFVAVDKNAEKRQLFSFLQKSGMPFIDVGMGLERVNDAILGILRTTIGVPDESCAHLDRLASAGDANDVREYERNIQIVELNALNAALAVIRWKKHRGIYVDLEKEVQSTYTLDGNILMNTKGEGRREA